MVEKPKEVRAPMAIMANEIKLHVMCSASVYSIHTKWEHSLECVILVKRIVEIRPEYRVQK